MKFKVFRFKKVNSTNSTAIRIIKNSNLKYGMIVSETQNNGRGQYGKKLISIYYKKKIYYKKPNDLLIQKKKISGILQEIIKKFNKRYLIVGIGINLIKSPKIKNYPTTSLLNMTNYKISKTKIEKQLKKIFEENIIKIKRD